MIGILIKENGKEIFKPQTHFNEAKLTAIALAVRFACLNRINVGETEFAYLPMIGFSTIHLNE